MQVIDRYEWSELYKLRGRHYQAIEKHETEAKQAIEKMIFYKYKTKGTSYQGVVNAADAALINKFLKS